jgi:hypothetical protein
MQELEGLGVFNNSHKAGGGLPVMGEMQWRDVKHHLERHLFEMVSVEVDFHGPNVVWNFLMLMHT